MPHKLNHQKIHTVAITTASHNDVNFFCTFSRKIKGQLQHLTVYSSKCSVCLLPLMMETKLVLIVTVTERPITLTNEDRPLTA